MSARESIQNGLAFVEDIHANVVNAFSILKSATDDPGSRSEMAYTCMQALENLSCLTDEIKGALAKLPDETNGSDVQGMVTALASRRPAQ